MRSIVLALRVLRHEGPRSLIVRSLDKLQRRLYKPEPAVMLVAANDATSVDFTMPGAQLLNPITVSSGPVRIAWIMSPPGPSSGGHQNLFRFIDFAEKAGHECTIHLYTTSHAAVSISGIREMLRESPAYPEVKANILMYDDKVGVGPEAQALFATGWETAYPVFRDTSRAKRFYFVQDFEANFYPIGTESLLAENTYRFGFHGITAGGWLAHKLRTDYGMSADHFDFAVDKQHYNLVNRGPRSEVFFYARPVTARRAFDFGVMALAEFAKLRPKAQINLAGWNVSNYDLPFKHKDYATLEISQLNSIYNRCAAGLVLSLTNMSLLPLELMSSGVAPVVNDGPNNRMVSDNPYIEYVPTSPAAIARRMSGVFDRPDAADRSIAMSESVARLDWSHSGAQFVASFERAMRA